MIKVKAGVRQRTGWALGLGLLGMMALGSLQVGAQSATYYGLKSGKPYNGTKLKFLICCLGAGQFAQLSKMTGEGSEFQKLTGIAALLTMCSTAMVIMKAP